MVADTSRPRAAGTPRERPLSRLERMIARLEAQAEVLDRACALVRHRTGPILEVGLGKGRTYDHLRTLLPGREIWCFDGSLHAPPAARPPADRLVLGDFRETLVAARGRLVPACLVHCDFGTEDPGRDRALAEALAAPIAALVAPRGLIASDRPLPIAGGTVIWRSSTGFDYTLMRV